MNPTAGVADAIFVIDGTEPSPGAADTASRLLGSGVHWTIVVVIPEHPRLTTGATGFAGPVLTPDEMDSIATSDVIAGDAAAAATASGFGDRPVTQIVLRGDLIDAITHQVDQHPTDLLVVDSADLAASLLDGGFSAVLVAAPAAAT